MSSYLALDPTPLDAILDRYIDVDSSAIHKLRNAAYIIKDVAGNTLYSRSVGKRSFSEDSEPFAEDSVCCIHSMAKLITAVAVLKAVYLGLVTLDEDATKLDKFLDEVEVLKGFDSDGNPLTTKKNGTITLRNMITHTAGFGLDMFDADLIRWLGVAGDRSGGSRSKEAIKCPQLYNVEEKWHYGAGLTWAGQIIESKTSLRLGDFMKEHILDPLGMSSTTFRPAAIPSVYSRLTSMALRTPSGMLVETKCGLDPSDADFEVDLGGGGMFSTASDYITFLSALLRNDSALDLPESLVDELFTQQLSEPLRQSFQEEISSPRVKKLLGRELVDDTNDNDGKGEVVCQLGYSLGGAINLEDLKTGRKKGSVRWLGAANTFWWMDKESGICGVFMTQVYPLGDKVVDQLLEELETEVYRQLKLQGTRSM